MEYLIHVIEPGLEEAFKRGDKKYHGTQHSHHPRILQRPADEDIHHVRELHVDVRLREAVDAADGDNFEGALAKIESAIGYLVILHNRINTKMEEEYGD
jgi:hypothetical protein